jgi:cold shock CspA family protein
VTNAQTYLGKMLWFNEEKGHGYIATDDGERLFVAGNGFVEAPPEGPCAGRIVEFEVGEDADGRFAERARLVEEISPRRARRRGSR